MNIRKTIMVVLACTGVFVSQAQVENDTVPERENIGEISAPIISLSEMDIEDGNRMGDLSGMLSSSKDPYVSAAGYIFGSARFRLRGYDNEYSNVYFNGVPVNDAVSGRPYWSSWGGLNDAVRNKEVETGIAYEEYGYGNIGGATNIIARASTFNSGSKVSYSATNRNYRNRLMYTFATGVNDRGFSLAVSGSRRWANEGYVEGTYYDAWAYFVSAEQKLNDKMSLGLIIYGSPNERAKAGTSTETVYELSDNNFYNSYWGYQDGEVRNSRISNYHQPRFILSHYWDVNEKSKIQTNFSYKTGRGGTTALNWAWGSDPRPDYYRNLPTYYALGDESKYDYYTEQWTNNEEFRQINWDSFYYSNRNNLSTVDNVYGEGTSISGNESKIILEERRNDISRFDVNSVYETKLNENITLNGGFEVTLNSTHYFKVVDDLLGGDFFLDVDKFADVDATDNPIEIQNDLNNPNNVVYVGDIFGYNYDANINKYKLFAQTDMSFGKFTMFGAIGATETQMWREGFMKKGLFPETSYGASEKINFSDFSVKAGTNFHITGNHILQVNAAYLTQAPTFRTAYLSPRTRNEVIDDLTSETVMSFDGSYIIKTNTVRGRLTGYYTSFTDQTWQRSFYHDDLSSFVNYTMTGVDKLNIGMEAALEVKLMPDLTLSAMFGKGQFTYNSDPSVTVTADNTSEILVDGSTSYLTDYRLGGMPQTVGSIGLKYWYSGWGFGANANYFGDMYVDINPARRTIEAAGGLDPSDQRYIALIEQQKLDDAITVDVFVMKSIYFNDYKLSISLNATNILNNQFAAYGYEQLRFNRENPEQFENKVGFLYGAQYYLNIGFKF